MCTVIAREVEADVLALKIRGHIVSYQCRKSGMHMNGKEMETELETDGELRARFIGIVRHRLMTDGDGVTTLVAFHGCPLRCRYCLNPQSLGRSERFKAYTPEEVYRQVKIDELYFLASGGGVTFGGGEPCLHPGFIREFRRLCGTNWRINLETSLHVPFEFVDELLPITDTLYIDIKDMDEEVYRKYTGRDNKLVVENLQAIAERKKQDRCVIRLPMIPGYNNESKRESGHALLRTLGFSRFDFFTYQTDK